MKFPLGAMNVGDVLDRGVRLLIARFPLIYGINFVMLLPIYLAQVVQPFLLDAMMQEGGKNEEKILWFAGAALGAWAFAALLTLLILPFGIASTLIVTIGEYLGRRTTFGDALRGSLRHFWGLIGTSLLGGLITTVGYVACCVPGIYLHIIYLFASQIVVAEATYGMAALNRSSNLVTGHWWRIFGVILLVSVIGGFMNGVVVGPLAIFLPAQEQIPQENGMPLLVFHPYNQLYQTLAAIPLAVLFNAYTSVCTTLLYLDMRIRKEGLDLEIAAQDMTQSEQP